MDFVPDIIENGLEALFPVFEINSNIASLCFGDIS